MTRKPGNCRIDAMGGYGSFLYSLHHPDMFCACAPLSAAVFDDTSHGGKKKQIAQGFIQPPVRAGRRTLEAKQCLEDPFRLESNNLPKIRYYIDCGDDDGLLDGNMQVHQVMKQKGIRHEFQYGRRP